METDLFPNDRNSGWKKIFLQIYQIIYLPFPIDEITCISCIVDQIVRINVIT